MQKDEVQPEVTPAELSKVEVQVAEDVKANEEKNTEEVPADATGTDASIENNVEPKEQEQAALPSASEQSEAPQEAPQEIPQETPASSNILQEEKTNTQPTASVESTKDDPIMESPALESANPATESETTAEPEKNQQTEEPKPDNNDTSPKQPATEIQEETTDDIIVSGVKASSDTNTSSAEAQCENVDEQAEGNLQLTEITLPNTSVVEEGVIPAVEDSAPKMVVEECAQSVQPNAEAKEKTAVEDSGLKTDKPTEIETKPNQEQTESLPPSQPKHVEEPKKVVDAEETAAQQPSEQVVNEQKTRNTAEQVENSTQDTADAAPKSSFTESNKEQGGTANEPELASENKPTDTPVTNTPTVDNVIDNTLDKQEQTEPANKDSPAQPSVSEANMQPEQNETPNSSDAPVPEKVNSLWLILNDIILKLLQFKQALSFWSCKLSKLHLNLSVKHILCELSMRNRSMLTIV